MQLSLNTMLNICDIVKMTDIFYTTEFEIEYYTLPSFEKCMNHVRIKMAGG